MNTFLIQLYLYVFIVFLPVYSKLLSWIYIISFIYCFGQLSGFLQHCNQISQVFKTEIVIVSLLFVFSASDVICHKNSSKGHCIIKSKVAAAYQLYVVREWFVREWSLSKDLSVIPSLLCLNNLQWSLKSQFFTTFQ